jgi:starch phosphorylase
MAVMPSYTAPDEVPSLTASIHQYLELVRARTWEDASLAERLTAVSIAVRRAIAQQMAATEARYAERGAKRLYYLSMEFLMGRSLANNLVNLEQRAAVEAEVRELGEELGRLEEAESDAALGNGGLGRLAACFLDSMATMGLPGFGYGINYEFGLFRQTFVDGFQREQPDHWFSTQSPWLVERMSDSVLVPVYGRVHETVDPNGNYNPMWLDWKLLVGVPWDMPIVGYGGDTVNVLRLFSARSSDDFDIDIFNAGDYVHAVQGKIASETVSKVLYPSDSVPAGRELRMVQEYFLVACALRDIVNRFKATNRDMAAFASGVAIQLNDTHPALMVAELMRLLVDEEGMPWERAWDVTVATLGYTNHTLLPEALEKWPVAMFQRILPRHLQIIFEINRRFLETLELRGIARDAALAPYSLIEEGPDKQVRMAHLAIVGSHSINGVAALHTQLLQQKVVPQFARLWPERFNNKTNGVTPRRWLMHCNPGLAALLTEVVGTGWAADLDRLRALEPLADSAETLDRLAAIKRTNKATLATIAQRESGLVIDPESMFDVQIKRIHEYKRQLLNALHIIYRYVALIEGAIEPTTPRTFIFAGKAAPGYVMAKRIIKLINSLADVVNADRRTRDWLRVVFLPDYRVSLAERIVPAADVSEQISTAGKEASGTGNMKLAMNGALTVGTLDGANIEIMEAVGADNVFIFGLTAEQVVDVLPHYAPREIAARDPRVGAVIDFLQSNGLAEGDLFQPIVDRLLGRHDEYVHLADLPLYIDTHERVDAQYRDVHGWQRKALLNIARMGPFSSDRTIREYAREIWGVE